MRNRILQNDEGISPVLGFILMLAVGVTILTTVQLTFVPVWNTQEELDHLKIMQDDFKVLKSNIESGILGGTSLSSPLTMGFKYSPKMLVYNPREEAYASLEVQNSTWVEVRYNEVFPEGMTDDTSIKNISTGMMVYALAGAQNYNAFIYENGLIRRKGSNYTTSSQTILANSTIFLPSVKALDYGSVSGVEKKTVNIYPTSQQKNSVIGKNVWIILHTKSDADYPGYVEWWAKILEDEGAGIRKKDASGGIVIANVSESLVIKMGEAYITASPKASPARSPPRRLVSIPGTGTVLPIGGTTSITVEVQDEYNNPVPNVVVNFYKNDTTTGHPSNSYSNATISPTSAVTGSDGRASVTLTADDAGFYYIDASFTDYLTTLVYSASSQGGVMKLDYSPKIPSSETFNVTATLTDSMGTSVPDGTQIAFETGDGLITSPIGTVGGKANATLNVSDATGIKITNIQAKDTTTNTTNITWDTINNITVTAKSGYVFNSRIVPTDISTEGCVFYGTSPGVYPFVSECDTGSSHLVPLTGLSATTAYYFIVNSSRPGKESVNSTEYMFVTDATGDDTPPGSITGLANITYESLYIRWTWTDPADEDFDHVEVMIDDISAGTVLKGTQSFNATYLMPGSDHNISIRTVDSSNNANGTWVKHNASTKSLLTYLADYSIYSGQGAVTDFSSAQSDEGGGGAAAMFNKTQLSDSSATNNYTYVTANSPTNGTVTNFGNMQSNTTGAYASLTEGSTVGADVNTGYYATSSPTGHSNAIGAPDNTLNSITNNYIRGSNFAAGGSGTITKVVLKYYYSITSYGAGDIPTLGYTLNSVDTIAKTDTGNVAYIYPNPTYTIDITSALGTWTWADIQSLVLWNRVQKSGAASTTANVDAFEVNVTINGAPTYSLNITADTTSILPGDSYYLEINYSRDSNDTYGIYVYDGSTWNNRKNLNIAAGTWENFSYLLTSLEFDNGARVRYQDDTPGGASQGNLFVDYQRIRGYTPGIPGGYHLDITTNTTGIPQASSQTLQLRYNVTGDNFTLQIHNGSTWDNRTTLNKTGLMDSIELPLSGGDLQSDGIFTPYTAKILNRYYTLVRYIDEDPAKQGKLYLDYQRVNSS